MGKAGEEVGVDLVRVCREDTLELWSDTRLAWERGSEHVHLGSLFRCGVW